MKKLIKAGTKKLIKPVLKTSVKVSLPTEKSKPITDFSSYSLLLYGRKKIGKTTLLSYFPKTFCMMFEPGGKALNIYQEPVRDWEEFKLYVTLLQEGDHSFKTVSIDTGYYLYEYCMDYVCKKLSIEHPSDLDYGKGWKAVKKELSIELNKLFNLQIGVVIICHEQIEEIKSYTGATTHRVKPNLSKQAYEYFAGVIDTIAYYHYQKDKRYLQIDGTDLVEAGTRCTQNFLSQETDVKSNSKKVKFIFMGDHEKDSFKNFIDAFNNKQKFINANLERSKKKVVMRKAV